MNELEMMWEKGNVPENGRGWPIMFWEVDGELQYETGDKPIIEVLSEKYDIYYINSAY